MKVLINSCYGGFGLSEAAMMRYAELKGLTLYPESSSGGLCTTYFTVPPDQRVKELENWSSQSLEARKAYNEAYNRQHICDRNIERNDPLLVQVVEELGEKASGRFASIQVVEIPDDASWEISEYDGMEHVAETHRTWS